MSVSSEPRHPPSVSMFRIVTIASCVLAGILLVALTVLAASPRARVRTVRTTLHVMGASLPRDADGHTNILLLGTGGAGHDGADLTDTMIIASIDPVDTRSIVMVSLPRDLFLDANRRMVNGRINAMYANEKYRLQAQGNMTETEASLAALEEVAAEIGAKTGVAIHGVLKADFTAFVNVVDLFGGVEVDVPDAIVDHNYPVSDTRTGVFRIDAGPQHLDGETALRYARSRYSTNDFDRSARQQQLIRALAAKAKSMGRFEQIALLLSLEKQLAGHVETTLTTEQLLGLAQISADLSLDRVVTAQINFMTGGDTSDAAPGGFVYPAPPEMFDGASILLPSSVNGKVNDWSQIRTFMLLLKQERALYLQEPVVHVQDFGAPRPQAHRLRNELLRYAWNAEPVSFMRAEDSPAASVIHYRDGDYRDAAELLGRLLAIPVSRTDASGSGDILIQLGSSYRYRPFETMSGAVLGNEQ